MASLLIADDHPLFRAALRQAARDALGEVELFEAGTLDAVLALLDAQPQVDLVLLDVREPGEYALVVVTPGMATAVVRNIQVFSGQLDVLDTAGARATAETWFRLETPYDGERIVGWWIRAEQVEEALRFARGIRERDLAAQLLNHAAEVVLREAVNASW